MRKTVELYKAINIAKLAYHNGPESEREGIVTVAIALADHCSFPYKADPVPVRRFIMGNTTINPYQSEKPAS